MIVSAFLFGACFGLALSILLDTFWAEVRRIVRRESALAALALQPQEEEKK